MKIPLQPEMSNKSFSVEQEQPEGNTSGMELLFMSLLIPLSPTPANQAEPLDGPINRSLNEHKLNNEPKKIPLSPYREGHKKDVMPSITNTSLSQPASVDQEGEDTLLNSDFLIQSREINHLDASNTHPDNIMAHPPTLLSKDASKQISSGDMLREKLDNSSMSEKLSHQLHEEVLPTSLSANGHEEHPQDVASSKPLEAYPAVNEVFGQIGAALQRHLDNLKPSLQKRPTNLIDNSLANGIEVDHNPTEPEMNIQFHNEKHHGGMWHATIQISPRSLGLIHAELRMDGDKATIRLQAESESTRNLLQSDLPLLRQTLSEAKIHTGEIGIQQSMHENNNSDSNQSQRHSDEPEQMDPTGSTIEKNPKTNNTNHDKSMETDNTPQGKLLNTWV